MLQASVQGQSLAVAFLTPGYMSKLVFGTFTEDLTTTLVRSGFRHLSLMAESPAGNFSDYEFDEDVPSDVFNPALSPGALEALGVESNPVDHLAVDAMVVDAVVNQVQPDVHPVVDPVNCVDREVVPVTAVQLPPPALPVLSAVEQQAKLDQEEQKGVNDYLRSYRGGFTFDGNHDKKSSVQEAWNQALNAVRAACALAGKRSNLAKVSFLQPHLSGRPLADYLQMIGQWAERREHELLKPSPSLELLAQLPPYQFICDELCRTYLAGQRKSMIELTELIRDAKLVVLAEKYGNNPFPTLAQVWKDYKAMHRERASLYPGQGMFDNFSLITHYLSCLPAFMRDMLRHVKDANGQVKEPNDPVMLENSILALGDQFLLDLKRRHDIKQGKRPVPSAGAASGSGIVGGGSNPSSSKKRGFSGAFDKGKGKGQAGQKKNFKPTSVFWDYNDPKTQSFWIRGLDFDKIQALKGKCLLCQSKDHKLPGCPLREKAFQEKRYYAFNRSKK